MQKKLSLKARGIIALLVVALLFIIGMIRSTNRLEQQPVDAPRGSIYYTGPMVTKPKGSMVPTGPPQIDFSKRK